MASVGIQKLLAQEPAPALRCGTEGRPRHQRRRGGNGDGNRDGDGDGNEDEYRTGAGTRTITEMEVEVRERLGTFEVVIEVSRKTRERGRRQRLTSNHSRET